MKLVILDRDGVINRDSDAFIKSVAEFEPLPGSIEAIADLTRADFTIAVATNQSGIARGLFDQAELGRIHGKLQADVAAAGGRIAHIAFCPHGPDDGCACRKPLPGMIDEIIETLNVPADAERWIVGDSFRDLQAGVARAFRPVLVRTGKGKKTLRDDALPTGTMVVDDLAQFASFVMQRVNSGN